jgi:hypothetical protein
MPVGLEEVTAVELHDLSSSIARNGECSRTTILLE